MSVETSLHSKSLVYSGYIFSSKSVKKIPTNDKVMIDHFLYENNNGIVTMFDVFKNFLPVFKWSEQTGFQQLAR